MMKKLSVSPSQQYSQSMGTRHGPRIGESAVEIVAEWLPNLAILDVDLPKMNGVDLAVALKSGHPDCRVLLFSGHPRTLDLLAQAKTEGHIFEILAKPTHPTVILEKASALLSGGLQEIAKPVGELD